MLISEKNLRKIIRQSLLSDNLTSEVSIADVPVVGFGIKQNLEPEIWKSDEDLDMETRRQLVKISEDFINSLTIKVKIVDIKFTGSLANYNWSKYSDIDLHLVVDFSKIDDDRDLVKGYFDYKRTLWNNTHDIKISGYDVEIYVEDINEDHVSTGIYSVLKNTWIIKPEPIQSPDIKFSEVKKKAASFMTQIDNLEKIVDRDPRKALGIAERIKEKIRKFRSAGLDSEESQFSSENIAFKVLRRTGYLKILSDLKIKAYDTMMSIND